MKQEKPCHVEREYLGLVSREEAAMRIVKAHIRAESGKGRKR